MDAFAGKRRERRLREQAIRDTCEDLNGFGLVEHVGNGTDTFRVTQQGLEATRILLGLLGTALTPDHPYDGVLMLSAAEVVEAMQVHDVRGRG